MNPLLETGRRLLVVSYGVGLDSTALLVELYNRGIRPDLIIFSDTGGEKPETYAYLAVINRWLASVGFPAVTIVRYEPARAPYKTLEGKCFANETLPSLAFGGHSCALVFKRDVMVKYLKSWAPARAAIARGEKIVKAIGYDASKADLRRRGKADRATDKIRLKIIERTDCGKAPQAEQWEVAHCEFAYYLQDWGLERASLAAIIEAAGLPLPCKSACFFCPASKPAEVVQLRLDHPDLFWRAVAMERRAREGRHGLTTKAGLGMGGWAWEWLADCARPEDADQHLRDRGAKVVEGLRP
jgi:hypothetical protein